MKLNELLLQEAPKGPDWKVLYKVRSKGGESWDGGSFEIKDYVGRGRAEGAALNYLEKNFKGREVKVVRITQKPWKKVPVQEATKNWESMIGDTRPPEDKVVLGRLQDKSVVRMKYENKDGRYSWIDQDSKRRRRVYPEAWKDV